MTQYVTVEDLEIINFALESDDSNVLIKKTPKGIRIIRETIKTLKNKEFKTEE